MQINGEYATTCPRSAIVVSRVKERINHSYMLEEDFKGCIQMSRQYKEPALAETEEQMVREEDHWLNYCQGWAEPADQRNESSA